VAILYPVVFGVALLFSLILTRWIRGFATARGWVAMPDSGRHLHTYPLPRLGGVAIFLAFLLATLFTLLFTEFDRQVSFGFSSRELLPIVLAGTMIFLLGVYDDIRGVGPYTKFALQTVAGLILFAGGLRFHHFAVLFRGQTLRWFVDLPLTLLWVLTITNAFNLIDGIDGLAAGSALFSTIVVFVVALLNHASLTPFLALALAGAIVGFLHYNLSPATIFLGDSGSLFIGFMLSALALQSAEKAPTIVAVAIPVVSFGLPILETVLSILRRWLSGRPLFVGDREHIHHQLLARGLSQRQVLVILYGASAFFGLLSLFLLRPTGAAIGIVLVILGSGIWIGVQHLGYLEFGELRRLAQRSIEQRGMLVNNLAILRAVKELRSVRDCEHLCQILVSTFGNNDFDGFELQLNTRPRDFVQTRGLRLVENGEGYPCLQWRKLEASSSTLTENSWRIDLDLVSKNGLSHGRFTLYRFYGDRGLQLDINLVAAEFPTALADALSRTLPKRRPIAAQVPASVAEAG
jgi:UDP-GlcNAc:undecaprenyl-phosphate GlcNAc-1-phosphate transferase